MKDKTCLFLFLFLCLFVLVSFHTPVPSCAQTAEDSEGYEDGDGDMEVEDSIEFQSPAGERDLINFDIFEDISRARARLEKMSCGFNVVRSKTVKKVKKGKRWKTQVKWKRRTRWFTILLPF